MRDDLWNFLEASELLRSNITDEFNLQFWFFFSLLYPSSQTPPQTRSSLGGNVWLFKSQRSMCIALRISAGFPLLFKSGFPIEYGFNQPLDTIHSQIHHVWNEWEQGPQGSGHNTEPDRVQECFGQFFHTHGVILGASRSWTQWSWWFRSNSAMIDSYDSMILLGRLVWYLYTIYHHVSPVYFHTEDSKLNLCKLQHLQWNLQYLNTEFQDAIMYLTS